MAHNSAPASALRSMPSGNGECQRKQVLSWLTENTPQPRIQHILRVEQTATQLAREHCLDPGKAAQAGLLHDLAKYFKPARLLEIARSKGLELTSVDEANPHLLHAGVSAVVAHDRFGVADPEILAAIANHTLGRPGMDLLSCVVFLADSLEPGRGNSPELEAIRQVCSKNLYQAVWMTCDRTLKHLIENGNLIHPRMVLTRNWALQIAQSPLGNAPVASDS